MNCVIHIRIGLLTSVIKFTDSLSEISFSTYIWLGTCIYCNLFIYYIDLNLILRPIGKVVSGQMDNYGRIGGMNIVGGDRRVEENSSTQYLSTTKPAWHVPESNGLLFVLMAISPARPSVLRKHV